MTSGRQFRRKRTARTELACLRRKSRCRCRCRPESQPRSGNWVRDRLFPPCVSHNRQDRCRPPSVRTCRSFFFANPVRIQDARGDGIAFAAFSRKAATYAAAGTRQVATNTVCAEVAIAVGSGATGLAECALAAASVDTRSARAIAIRRAGLETTIRSGVAGERHAEHFAGRFAHARLTLHLPRNHRAAAATFTTNGTVNVATASAAPVAHSVGAARACSFGLALPRNDRRLAFRLR